MKFDAEKVRQGLGCLTETAPLVKACEFYHKEVVEPEICRLEGKLSALKHAYSHTLEQMANINARMGYQFTQIVMSHKDKFRELTK